jgi:hypothetical protein
VPASESIAEALGLFDLVLENGELLCFGRVMKMDLTYLVELLDLIAMHDHDVSMVQNE